MSKKFDLKKFAAFKTERGIFVTVKTKILVALIRGSLSTRHSVLLNTVKKAIENSLRRSSRPVGIRVSTFPIPFSTYPTRVIVARSPPHLSVSVPQ